MSCSYRLNDCREAVWRVGLGWGAGARSRGGRSENWRGDMEVGVRVRGVGV